MLAHRLVTSAAPYLGGTNVAAGQRPAFHGARGGPRVAASGGFYWGAAIGAPGGPLGLRRVVAVGGWLIVGLVAIVGVLAAAGVIS